MLLTPLVEFPGPWHLKWDTTNLKVRSVYFLRQFIQYLEVPAILKLIHDEPIDENFNLDVELHFVVGMMALLVALSCVVLSLMILLGRPWLVLMINLKWLWLTLPQQPRYTHRNVRKSGQDEECWGGDVFFLNNYRFYHSALWIIYESSSEIIIEVLLLVRYCDVKWSTLSTKCNNNDYPSSPQALSTLVYTPMLANHGKDSRYFWVRLTFMLSNVFILFLPLSLIWGTFQGSSDRLLHYLCKCLTGWWRFKACIKHQLKY